MKCDGPTDVQEAIPLSSLPLFHSPSTLLFYTITFYSLSKCYSASVATMTNTQGGRLPFERRPFSFVRTGQSNPPGLQGARRQSMSSFHEPPCHCVKTRKFSASLRTSVHLTQLLFLGRKKQASKLSSSA